VQWKQSKKIVEHQIEVYAGSKLASVIIPNVKSHVWDVGGVVLLSANPDPRL
jgi:hypothetical protein